MAKYIGTLVIPRSAAARELKVRHRARLTWTTDGAASQYATGVIVYSNGELLDGFTFRGLRDSLGATIETKDPEKVCRALGLPGGELGIGGRAMKPEPPSPERVAQLLSEITAEAVQQMDALHRHIEDLLSGEVTPEQVRTILKNFDKDYRFSRKKLKELEESIKE